MWCSAKAVGCVLMVNEAPKGYFRKFMPRVGGELVPSPPKAHNWKAFVNFDLFPLFPLIFSSVYPLLQIMEDGGGAFAWQSPCAPPWIRPLRTTSLHLHAAAHVIEINSFSFFSQPLFICDNIWCLNSKKNGSYGEQVVLVLAVLTVQYNYQSVCPYAYHLTLQPIYLIFSVSPLHHRLASMASKYHLQSSLVYTSCLIQSSGNWTF